MEIEIFGEKVSQRMFKLTSDKDFIYLVAVNERGEIIERGVLLVFQKEDGAFYKAGGINETLGLKLDCYGQLAEYW